MDGRGRPRAGPRRPLKIPTKALSEWWQIAEAGARIATWGGTTGVWAWMGVGVGYHPPRSCRGTHSSIFNVVFQSTATGARVFTLLPTTPQAAMMWTAINQAQYAGIQAPSGFGCPLPKS